MANAFVFIARSKDAGSNFSRGGLPAFFNSREGVSIPIYGRFNGQNEGIFGPGEHGPPLPRPAYANGKILQNLDIIM